MDYWYQLKNPDQVASPALLVYPERIKRNIQEMIRISGDVNRLRPHVKTHKSPHVVALQQQMRITKFKCATIAEAEMLALCEVPDVLIAYQLSGPNAWRLIHLMSKYPNTSFSALVDNMHTAKELYQIASHQQTIIQLYIDLDVGMHRTGISPGPAVLELHTYIKNSEALKFNGWHVYDGHVRQSDFTERQIEVSKGFEAVRELQTQVDSSKVVAGGSPTFPVHALDESLELSPGTSLLWDQGYGQQFPDLEFLKAAVLITRVISKPAGDMLCLDLGHKALASEMSHPRVHLLGLEVVEFTTHSEEHLVVRTPDAPNYQVGDAIYGIPMHICPTTALHQNLIVVESGEVVDSWPVLARNRKLEI